MPPVAQAEASPFDGAAAASGIRERSRLEAPGIAGLRRSLLLDVEVLRPEEGSRTWPATRRAVSSPWRRLHRHDHKPNRASGVTRSVVRGGRWVRSAGESGG